MLPTTNIFSVMYDFIRKPSTVAPKRKLHVEHADLNSIPDSGNFLVWFGHSSYLVKSQGYTILVDPVFSKFASPIKVFGKAIDGTAEYDITKLPVIDLLLLTHDHYDHLDYETIQAVKHNVGKVIAPLGVGEHLEYWGMTGTDITELDWYQTIAIGSNLKLTSTPSRHFSGRGIKRNQTLWCSYVLEVNGLKLFIGGDSGYDDQFKQIGSRYGPFDLAILESGQYGDNWPLIHMRPEETVQAAIELGAKVLLPVHWGKFVLALHPWDEPVRRIIAAAKQNNLPVVTPTPGAIFEIGSNPEPNPWWER